MPASEIFRVAEAVLRVFQRLGDYQHKQRNRMKFMIKELGWTRFREEYDRELSDAACRARADARDRSARSEADPDWPLEAAPEIGDDRRARDVPGRQRARHRADGRRRCSRSAATGMRRGARRTSGRRSSSAS